jgi:predicted Zn-dependent protease
MLEQHDDVRIARSDRMEAFRQVLLTQADAQPGAAKAKPAATTKLIDLTALGTQLRQSATVSLVDVIFGSVGNLSQSYDSPAERWSLLEQYVASAYPKRRDKTSVVSSFDATIRGNAGAALLAEDQAAHAIMEALGQRDRRAALALADQAGVSDSSALSLRLAQAQTYSEMNRFDRAVPLLESVTKTTLAPASAYRHLAEGYARTNRQAEASASLQLGMRRIGREHGFLPDLVGTSRRERQTDQAESYAMECAAVERRDMLSNPFAALTVPSNQSGKQPPTLYSECVRRLGYDPVKRRESQSKREAQSVKFPDLNKILSR